MRYVERYDMKPMEPVVRFIDVDGETTTMGYLVRPQWSPVNDYHANKAARSRIANLKGPTMRVGIHYGCYGKRCSGEDGPYEITVDVFHVEAVDDDGHVWELEGSYSEDEEKVKALLAALDHDPTSRPEKWFECEPVYGSNAWDSEAEYRLACFEADCFDEPRPRW